MNKIFRTALFNALGTGIYITFVGLFMYYGTKTKIGLNMQFLAPIAMLLLFVFSASLTGYLIFGKPALLYIDGKKKESLTLLSYTLLILFIITAIILSLLIFLSQPKI